MVFSKCLSKLKLRKEIKREIRKIKKENFKYVNSNAFLTFCMHLNVSPKLQALLIQNANVIVKSNNLENILVSYHIDKKCFSYMYINTQEVVPFPILNNFHLNRLVRNISKDYIY